MIIVQFVDRALRLKRYILSHQFGKGHACLLKHHRYDISAHCFGTDDGSKSINLNEKSTIGARTWPAYRGVMVCLEI